jgi:hypothetical protein
MSKTQISRVAINGNFIDAESFRANQLKQTKRYRATQLYMQLAKATRNIGAQKVLNEVMNKNRVHVDESLKLLHELAIEEEKVMSHRTEIVDNLLHETM